MDVSVRPATASDVDALARLFDLPERAIHRLLHERTIRLGTLEDDPVAALAYDWWEETVHVTHLGGDAAALQTLLADPRRVAQRRDAPIEVVVPAEETATVSAVESSGFERVGAGPAFDGQATHRYRLPPGEP
ncbi:MAG: hypothetical protein ABEJ57_05695 [Halobacteriaceae archaeon]